MLLKACFCLPTQSSHIYMNATLVQHIAFLADCIHVNRGNVLERCIALMHHASVNLRVQATHVVLHFHES